MVIFHYIKKETTKSIRLLYLYKYINVFFIEAIYVYNGKKENTEKQQNKTEIIE